MALSDPDMIRAAMQFGAATAQGTTLVGATAIDNEALIAGLTRHIRRIVAYNLHNETRVLTFASGTGAAGTTALKKSMQLITFGYMVLEPLKDNEDVIKWTYVATTDIRFMGYLSVNTGSDGVLVNIDYWDDMQ